MIPSLRITWLACTTKGLPVRSFDAPDKLHAFIADRARKGVRLLPVRETTKRVLVEQPERAPVRLRIAQ